MIINLPRFDVTNNNVIILIFFISIIFFTLIHLEINKILVMIFLLFFFIYYNKFIKHTEKFFFRKKDKNEFYNNKIERLLYEIKEYEKITPYRYTEGYEIWKLFIEHINKLESDELYNYTQYFENAHFYLKKSCNIFMGMTIEARERKYIEGIEYGDFENSKELKRISNIIKELYKEGYGLLYNLSLRLNKRWDLNKNIHNKEIIFNVPEPRDTKNKYINKDFF